jgi:predicted TPR repeat methyltransferase
MAKDPFQIALEHHRAGRFTQAEAGYKSVLQSDAANADAMHWLGVLLCQAGQFNEAISLLEDAAAIRPGDAAFLHNLGQAYLNAGRTDQAIDSFERAAANDSGAEALVAAALARLARRKPGDAEAAVAALRKAQAGGLATADLYHHLGIALLAAGHADGAIAACKTSLARKPDHAATLYHLALAHRKMGQGKETRKCLIKALEIDPTLAQAWCALAMLDAEAGRLSEAAGLFRRAIAADRQYAPAYQGLGQVLQAAGKRDEARQAFAQAEQAARGQAGRVARPSVSIAELEQHLTPTESQAQAHFAMATLMNVFPPSRPPAEAVEGLFERYAPNFDTHLVGALDYHVPEMMAAAIESVWDGRPLDILDLGCGTGLCGPLLRKMAKVLAGVDLSAGMIEKARARGVYDRLEACDMVEALRKSPHGYDLLVCADVLIYLGDLSPTFEAALAALRPGGMFAFSVEASRGERYELVQRSRRFAHSKTYLQHLAGIYGFEEKHFAEIVVRKEMDQPVAGYLVILRAAIAD